MAFPLDTLPQDHSQGANQSGKGRSLSSQTLGEVESPLHRYLEKYQGMTTCWVPIRRSKAIISDWINWMKCCLSIECEIQAERKGKSKSGKNPKTIRKTIWKSKAWTSWLKPVPWVEVFWCIHHMDWTKSSCKEFWQLESKVQSQHGRDMKINLGSIWLDVWMSASGHLLSPSLAAAHPFYLPRCSQCLAFAHLPALELGPRLGPDFTTLTWDIHQLNSLLGNFHRSEKGTVWRMTTANRPANIHYI